MSHFKGTFLRAVEEILFDSGLDSADFSIHTSEFTEPFSFGGIGGAIASMKETYSDEPKESPREGARLTITCLLDKELFFRATIFPNSWNLRKQPGASVLLTDIVGFSRVSEATILTEVESWARDVYWELTIHSTSGEPERVYVHLDELRAKLADLPDEPFTPAEMDELTQKLSEVEERLKEQINKTYQDAREKERRIERLEQDIAFLKQSINNLSKKSWYTGLTSRLARWYSTEEGQAALTTESSKNLLPDYGFLEPLEPSSDKK